MTNPSSNELLKDSTFTEEFLLPKVLMPLGEQKRERMDQKKTPRRHYFVSM